MNFNDYERCSAKAKTEAMVALKKMVKKSGQAAVAESLGFSEAYISYVLSGKKKMSDKFLKAVLG